MLLRAALELAAAHDLGEIADAVRRAARELTGADGVTFVLREGPLVHYVDEDAIAPLWKGMRFPATMCISGWAMLNRQAVVVEDVFADDRIPHDVYRPTFVKSLAMVPVRPEDPVAAIGAYWAHHHRATPDELRLVSALAGYAAVALENLRLVSDLREAVAARDTFLAIAAHELRTPLAALALQVGMAERRVSAPDAQLDGVRGALDRISRTVKRLGGLIEHLLDASMVGQHRIPLHRKEVDLAATVRDAAEALGDPAHADIRVEAASAVVGRWDAERIERAVYNLLANAVKFGSGRPIEIAVAAVNGMAQLTVHDRGIGIPPEAQARIFDRFARAVPTANYGGFGLGLWLTRQTVEAHGGTIAVASAPGEGATFTVRLPLAA
ncbi:hypothetical protein AMOR_04300 [Anaeromyxobacter oryzae]|uniref:histidine kinase n=1 Tax=Anaeromyxobacter oryzae TaxID=2918170 RepID=A0ABM7WPP2_9BACT|nr:hypothetical protein AMOR_04300 [Anaeromyxobacter oryzae]